MSDIVHRVLADLRAEGDALDALVARGDPGDWQAATPAAGWTVAHQIAHLAWTDRRALLSARDEDAFRREAAAAAEADPYGFVDAGAEAGAAQPPGDLLADWRTGRAELLTALADQPSGRRLAWYGPPISVAGMASARIMETWAHGEDVADAFGVAREPTARLRHVVHLGVRTRDFAHLLHGITPPAAPFRVELTAPDGTVWAHGPQDAAQRVTGNALDFCLLVTQRRHRADLHLRAEGADADRWLDIAQAFAGPPGAGRSPPRRSRMTGIGADPDVLRVGNASGFYGDRFTAVHEMLTGGELDVLTGDYLAELTLLILGRDRLKDPSLGYAKTFLRQLEQNLALAHERGVRIVANAGGLNPAGLAAAVRELADRVGVPVRVAHVEGDDVREGGWGEGVLTANAYLGGGGITACLRAGADVVVTGRVTDAALVTGAAAAHFGWGPGDLDPLAGAVVAGHVLECGTQATGGNYAFFARAGLDVRHPGFPLAELHADGSAVITKHPGTGGAVTVGTVTAQLLYETAGARYLGPDVTARLDTVRLHQDGPDRVRVEGVRGEAPPPRLKVGLTRLGGHRNEVVFVLTGLDIDAKAALVRAQMEAHLDAAGRRPAEVAWTLARTDHADAPVQEEASALLRLVVRDRDEKTVGRAVSSAAVELALASYPGFHVTAPPGRGAPYGVFEVAWADQADVPHTAVLPDGTRVTVPPPPHTRDDAPAPAPDLPPPLPAGPSRRAPLGEVAGARSGDKGGSANVGVWARDDAGWRWLAHALTEETFRALLPETAGLPVTRHLLPNLRALNFVVDGLLGDGVASQARFDPQAKALGEWLRARRLDIPEELLP